MRISFRNSPPARLRILLAFLIVDLAIASAAPTAGARQMAPDPEIEPWLAPGTEVVLKDPNTPIRDHEWLSVSGDHLAFRIESVRGERLLVASRDKARGGWLNRDQVVALDRAVDYFTREIDRTPHHPDAYWMRGRVWAYTGEEGRALADFDRAIQLRPDRAPYYLRRALILIRNRRAETALADLDRAIELDPRSAGPYVLRSSLWLARGETRRAQADLDQAIRLDPLKPSGSTSFAAHQSAREREARAAGARLLLAMHWEEAERSSRPTDDGEKAARDEPKTVPELFDRGLTLFQQKNYNAAIADFTRAIQLDPNSARLYAYRAQSWGAKHNRDQEIADLNQAIRLEPRNTQYLLSRAGAWSSQGRHDEAMANYDAAIRLEPDNPALYVARGNEWRRHIKLDLALADYNRAIQIDPNYTHAYIARALIARQRRDFARAVAELTAIARMAPDDAEAHRLLARILATCNNDSIRDGDRAVREAIRACELTNWLDPDSIDTLAAAYAEIGDYSLAVQWQTKAIDLVRHNVPSALQRAMNFNGRRGVGFEDRLAFYKRKRPARE